MPPRDGSQSEVLSKGGGGPGLHPRLLFVDEPSLGLGPRMVETVFSSIVAINCEGTGVLMGEQNARRALAISHRRFVLELGRNRFAGTGQARLDNPEVRAPLLRRLRVEMGSTSSGAGIPPAQTRKAAVVPVARHPLASRLDRQRGQIGVGNQVALDPGIPTQADENVPVPLSGRDVDTVRMTPQRLGKP